MSFSIRVYSWECSIRKNQEGRRLQNADHVLKIFQNTFRCWIEPKLAPDDQTPIGSDSAHQRKPKHHIARVLYNEMNLSNLK